MANTEATTAFISLNDIINNFIISYTGPGKLIPDSKRTEVIFHARRCLQEFAYETLKSKFTITDTVMPSGNKLILPNDFVTTIQVGAKPTSADPFVAFTQAAYLNGPGGAPIVGTNDFSIEYSSITNDGKDVMHFSSNNSSYVDFELTYLSNALTTDESAAIPKLAEEALYACMVYAILANREKTNPNTLQRLLIEKIDKLERSKSRLIFTNFSE